MLPVSIELATCFTLVVFSFALFLVEVDISRRANTRFVSTVLYRKIHDFLLILKLSMFLALDEVVIYNPWQRVLVMVAYVYYDPTLGYK